MKVLHMNAGGEVGGGNTHIVSLVAALGKEKAELLVFEEGPVAQAAREAGCTVYILGQQSRYDLRILGRLRTFLKKRSYDVIHTHGARANSVMALLSKSVSSIWLVTVHSDPALDFKGRGLKGKIFETLNIRSLSQADHLITVSGKVKEQLRQLGIDGNKITIVRNGIPFSPPPEPKHTKTAFTMVYAARLHPIKGHSLLFESLAKADLPEWKLLLAGDGMLKEELKQQAAELGIEENVSFLDWVEPEKLKELLRSADLSLLASFSETFPLVLLESANEGVPFIASDVGDIHALLPDSSYGWLVPPSDSDALAEAIEEASAEWKNGELIKKGKRLYERTKELFSINHMTKQTLSVYQKLLDSSRH